MNKSDSFSNATSTNESIEQLSIGQVIVLHLLPGAIGTVVYILSVPIFTNLGYPSITALYLPMILAVILLELGYLFYQGQKKNGQRSLTGVVNYRERVPGWMYVAFPLLILVWGVLVTGLVSPLDNLILNKSFSWLPDWYTLKNVLDIKTIYSHETILVTAICALILNGLLGPIVEELYFRGYLLPRISRLGRWAPLLNVVLFSFYHFWTPWMFFSRVVLLIPMIYIVKWNQNIYIGMIAHCLLNLIGTVVLFAQLLG